MSEKTLELTVDLDGKVIKITTERCTTKNGVKRFRMMIAAEETNKEEADVDLSMLRLYTYPQILCGTRSVEGLETPWPITLEQFADLPEDLTNEWLESVYKSNPSWRPSRMSEETKLYTRAEWQAKEEERQAAEKKG